MAEVSGHTTDRMNIVNVFHDVNSILYTTHPVAGNLLKVIIVFCNENLTLFMLTIIHSIRKSTKNRNSETRCNRRRKATEKLRLKQVKRQKNRVDK